jgi:hypothetical protein
MKHVETITTGQKIFKFKLSETLIDKINGKMDANILKNNTFISKKSNIINENESPRMDYISSINNEYRILDWIGDIDNESEIKKCITHVYNNSDFDQKENFDLISINMHDAWISDQVESEYQVVHRHSGYSEIGFACVLYLLIPDFGKPFSETEVNTNGMLTFVGNSNGLFANKNHTIFPSKGDLYIFPYDIHHSVYPFRGDGVRRSMSINFDVNHVRQGYDIKQRVNYYEER